MKLLFIDNFRTVAIILIVMSHTLSFFDWSNTPKLEVVMEILIENSTSLFIFISGYLFQYLLPRYKFKKYFKGKIKFVALPYFLASIPAIFYFTAISERIGVPEEFYSSSTIYQIINFYATGLHLAPYWYIPAIFIFFIMSPIFKYLSDKRNLLLLSFPVFLIVSMIIARDGVIYSFVHFISIYIAGMIANQYSNKIDFMSKKPLIIGGFISLFASIITVQYLTNEDSFQLFYLQKLTLCLIVLLLMRRHMSDKLFFIDLSVTSFGIFFIHSYIITACKILIDKTSMSKIEGGIIENIIFTLLILTACHLIVKIIKYIFKTRSRYIIGS